MDYYQKDEVIKYNINRFENELNIKLMPELPVKEVYKSPLVKAPVGVFEPDYLPLYILASLILFLVVLTSILSSIFAYWWNKNKRPESNKSLHYKVDADSTKHPLLISEPNTPHLHDQIYGNFMPAKEPINSPDLTAGSCQTGFINPLRYNIRGSIGTTGNPSGGLGNPTCSSGLDSLTNQQASLAAAINEQLPFVLTGGFDEYPGVDNMELLATMTGRSSYDNLSQPSTSSNQHCTMLMPPGSMLIGSTAPPSSSLTNAITSAASVVNYSTLPLNYKLVYSTGSNITPDGTTGTGSYFTAGSFDNYSLNPASLASSNNQMMNQQNRLLISSPAPNIGGSRHLAKDFLDEHFLDRVGLNVLTQISEKDITDFNNSEIMTQGKQCPLDGVGVYQQLSNNTGQGSDETSGILSDSSGSTLDKPAQSSNAKISAGFSIVPSVIERYVSLDANDQRYIPLSNVMIAEVAQCPQHSYLVQGQGSGNSSSGCSTLPTSSHVLDWGVSPASSGTTTINNSRTSVIHGAQVHGLPGDRQKINSSQLSSASSFQTVVEADGTSYYRDTTSSSLPRQSKKMPSTQRKERQNSGNDQKKIRETPGKSNQYFSATNEIEDEESKEMDDDDDYEEGEDGSSNPNTASPKSALKGSRSNSRVSKQLRFTTFGLLFLLGSILVGMIDADDVSDVNKSLPNSVTSDGEETTKLVTNYVFVDSKSNKNGNTYYNDSDTILPSALVDLDYASPSAYSSASASPLMNDDVIQLSMTIFVPKKMWTKVKIKKESVDSNFNNNKSIFRIYFNESSRTTMEFGDFQRINADIYDVKNSLNILSPQLCRKRYSCSHSCDPSNGHRCICQRGYTLSVDGKSCIDIDECADTRMLSGRSCSSIYGNRGICVNLPGSFQCICYGQPCKDCSEKCPEGHYKKASCRQSKFLQCEKCTEKCSAGYYISRKCTKHSNTQCRACRPLCITGEFELSPCSGYSNRVCKTISSIPGIELPDKKNIWYENRQQLTDISHIIAYDEMKKLSRNRILKFERKSGYQIVVKFLDDIHLKPVLEPVDHSQSNDNQMFRTDPSNYTLKHLCPYPLPPKYSLNMMMHYNVTTDVVNDANLPGYRATLHSCNTYMQHGNYPDPVTEMINSYRKPHWSSSLNNNYLTSIHPTVISCLEPGKLPMIFGDMFNEQLAIRDGVYVEANQQCSKLKSDCQRCLVNCAHHMISNSLVCKPTGSPADNGRSPRLEMCYDCCAQDNCTSICEKYATNHCSMHLCMKGPRMDLNLDPDWPKKDKFICHMKLSESPPIFRLKWSLLQNNKQLTMDEFHEQMFFQDNGWHGNRILSDITKVFKGLIHVSYSSNIGTFPDIISGNSELQEAFLWNTEKLPLATSSARILPDGRSATLEVWPNQPLAINSGKWGQIAQRDNCQRSADFLVSNLNNYTDKIPPFTALTNIRVERAAGSYRYRISHNHHEPRLNFTVPASASLLGAIFSRVFVYRREYLSASLIYLGPGGDNKGYWIIELTGQVSNFPGYFRLQTWNGDEKVSTQSKFSSDTSESSKSSKNREDEPLLDYDIGVFEEKNFKMHLRIPAPNKEPNFDKTFLLRIIDSLGELEIFVHRAQQDLKQMSMIDKYSRAQDGKYPEEPSILPEVMSVSGEVSLKDSAPLGIPQMIIFAVVVILVIALFLLLIGHLTRKEEHLCEDIVFKTRHLFVFVVYMIIKSIYCFSITTTALLIVLVIYTREPYVQLTSHNSEHNNNTVAERLLIGRMDSHLEKELMRQLEHVVNVKQRCDNRLNRYYDKLNQRLEEVSANAAKRRSRVLISQAVVERAQYELKNVVDQLMRNLEDFNKTAKIYMKKIKHDMEMTKQKLANSKWLEGAKLIYQEVLRRRNEAGSSAKDDPTKSFLSWLKISGELPSSPPQLTLPSNIPFPDWADLDIPIPPPRSGSGKDAEYGPEYKPFDPKEKDLELEQSIWSYYDPPKDANFNSKYPSQSDSSNPTNPDDRLSDNDANKGDGQSMLYMESIEAIYKILIQLTWHHLMALTLLLDILWLLHRAAHTVDTAEQIIYGYPCFIDCTVKGKRRRRRNENNFKFMLKRTFCETMESSFVPKFCGSAFALFILYLLSIHLNELISEEVLDYVGYYDNMALPAHLRNRFVNTQVVQSAKQLNEYELSSYEQFVHQRQSEIQDILNAWVEWTSQLEQYQCDILKQYKTTDDGKLISDILNKPNNVPIPSHCLLSESDRVIEKKKMADFKMSVCPVRFVTPVLFTEYNETSVSMQIVKSSRHWLKWTRKWVDIVLQCVFGYVAALVLWNTLGSTTWFFVKRFSLIRQKRIYETDFQAMPPQNDEQNMKTTSG